MLNSFATNNLLFYITANELQLSSAITSSVDAPCRSTIETCRQGSFNGAKGIFDLTNDSNLIFNNN